MGDRLEIYVERQDHAGGTFLPIVDEEGFPRMLGRTAKEWLPIQDFLNDEGIDCFDSHECIIGIGLTERSWRLSREQALRLTDAVCDEWRDGAVRDLMEVVADQERAVEMKHCVDWRLTLVIR